MMIHSITPLEMLVEQPELPPVSIRQVEGGYVEGVETPQGFSTTRLCSTNPRLYLKNQYTPGSILGPETH